MASIDPTVFAAIVGASGALMIKLVDVFIQRHRSTIAQGLSEQTRMSKLDSALLQQRQQLDEASSKFRGELQGQIDQLNHRINDLVIRNETLSTENTNLRFKVLELEYKVRLMGGDKGG